MTQRDRVRSALRGHDAGHARHRKHVAFLDLAVDDGGDGLGPHDDLAPSDGPAVRRLFRRDVDHAGVARRVEMGELRIAHAESTVAGYVAHMTSGSRSEARADDRPDGAATYDPVAQLRAIGDQFIDLIATSDLTASVPACSPWQLKELAVHIGEGWHFWSMIIGNRVVTRAALHEIADVPAPDDDVASWLRTRQAEILEALEQADSDTEVWTWTGANRDVAWVQRRLVQELAIHRWDAAHATHGEFEIPSAVAVDGIDEFLTWFAASERREGEMKVGGTVHLHCTDTAPGQGEWFISAMKEPAATFTREHRKGDAAIRGSAHNILLWLWRRKATVEVVGNEVVARRFRAFTALD